MATMPNNPNNLYLQLNTHNKYTMQADHSEQIKLRPWRRQKQYDNEQLSTNSGVVVVQEAVTNKLECDRGLADPAVAEHRDLIDAEAARRARSLGHAAACRQRGPRRAAPAVTPHTLRPPSAQTTRHYHRASLIDNQLKTLAIYHTFQYFLLKRRYFYSLLEIKSTADLQTNSTLILKIEI